MSRQVKRVRLDFDWPIGMIWPPFMGGICEEEVLYCIGKEKKHDEACEACRHAAKLAGIIIKNYGCPTWSIEPLIGDGWQMWETTSEGSPISPVFKTPEELARWLTESKASAFGRETANYETWFAMILKGWAPSAVLYSKEKSMISGVEFIAHQEKENP